MSTFFKRVSERESGFKKCITVFKKNSFSKCLFRAVTVILITCCSTVNNISVANIFVGVDVGKNVGLVGAIVGSKVG